MLRCLIATVCVLSGVGAVVGTAHGDELSPAANVDYERLIKPLLLNKCAACHGAIRQSSGLRLDHGSLIRKGGESGAAIEPGQSDASLLIQRVSATDSSQRMPPEGQGEKLTNEQIELLRKWIDAGAHSPQDEEIPEDPAHYWSYQSPVMPDVPGVKNAAWVRTPIDAFIAAQHETRGLLPSPEAPREVWLRRVHLDLIGIPPTQTELHDFLKDQSESAYDAVVDRLLARPEYGQRWGRHWMDVWRYSDWYGSRGINEIRYSQRHIWRWRDWIVESLNEDKPYDRMIMEMLAGDELAPADPNVLRATGYLGRNWYKFDRNVWMFDTVEQTSQAFLGLTMKCARCHDHKFDPITQEDYYHLRAFFEPHDVRTDPISGSQETEKDATLGPVLREGVARVYDKELEAKTFVFERGDNRYPDQSRLMSPAVPKALGSLAEEIQTVALPADAWQPHLRAAVADGLVKNAESEIALTTEKIRTTQAEANSAQQALTAFEARLTEQKLSGATGEAIADAKPVLNDQFASRTETWKVMSGKWDWKDGRLIESSVGNFSTIVADVIHPRNFQARVRYRTLQPGSIRSVGFSFDYIDNGNSQDVYTATGDSSQSVQAFHRKDGQQFYPAAGIVRTKLPLGEETVVEITVREQLLQLKLNGEHKLDYVIPEARREGQFALWVHSGSAEFLEVVIRELVPSLTELQLVQQTALHNVKVAEQQLVIAEKQKLSLMARLTAERAKYSGESPERLREKNRAASRAEREVAAARVEAEVLAAEHLLALAYVSSSPDKADTDSKPSLTDAEKKLTEAQAKLADAIGKADETYTALGPTYPSTSTGRRLALARWIVGPQNPRASRIAVNHIWLRHFGEALVPSVANFGLNGQRPSHPELLDWLATELVRQKWRMKPIHRMIVLSSVYRQTSATGPETDVLANNNSIDLTNRFLWRMNSRRMESEAVRDSVLAVSGKLDCSLNGPEIPESESLANFRRSLYFRSTPNEKAGFLETFDAANPNECYRRQESVVPQQALALMNSSLTLDLARQLAEKWSTAAGEDDSRETRLAFLKTAFESLLTREPTTTELESCLTFLDRTMATITRSDLKMFPAGGQTSNRPAATEPWLRARENLVHVLFSHNDFVTIR
ncbi:MAG: DUF1553 domain-containing protein [Planctomycetaceae bacterium]